MNHAEDQPRVASKAKLRLDPKTGKKVLLSPEKGLVLNGSAEKILGLCDGQRNFQQIVTELAQAHGHAQEQVERDTAAFLDQLAERGLIEGWSR